MSKKASSTDQGFLPPWAIDTSKPHLESEKFKDPEIYLVELQDLKLAGSFPEYPKAVKRSKDVDLDNSLIVLASHSWIALPRRVESRRMERQVVVEKVDTSKFHFEGEVDESSEEEVDERPNTPESATKEYTVVDTFTNDKYHLYVEALEKIKEELAPEMERVYMWMDYCCLDQVGRKGDDWVDRRCPILSLNNVPGNGDLILFDRVVALADCVLTCVFDQAYKDTPWNLQPGGSGLHGDYKSPLWQRYLERRWTRLEMAYSAHVPFWEEGDALEYDEQAVEAKRSETKSDVFDRRLNPLVGRGITRADRMRGSLQYERLQGRRAHLLYGTRESVLRLSPKLLPVLTKEDVFNKYNPAEGPHSRPEDAVVLQKLERELWPFTRRGEAGYDGERDLWAAAGGVGRKHGKGTMSYPNGNVYTGDWVKNRMEGHGLYSYYQGEGMIPDIYEGSLCSDLQHGEGTYTRGDGSFYRGGWHMGKRQGFGHFRWPDGSEYRGYFHDDERHGFGRLQAANGDLYEGMWECGRRVGQGKMTWNDGCKYNGEWKNNLRHGKGVGFDPFGRGAEYDGEWENGMKMGRGKLTIGKGVITKPQVLEGIFSCDNYLGPDGWEEEDVNLRERKSEMEEVDAIAAVFELDSEEEEEEERAVEEDLQKIDQAAELYRRASPGKEKGVAFFEHELAASMIKPRQNQR